MLWAEHLISSMGKESGNTRIGNLAGLLNLRHLHMTVDIETQFSNLPASLSHLMISSGAYEANLSDAILRRVCSCNNVQVLSFCLHSSVTDITTESMCGDLSESLEKYCADSSVWKYEKHSADFAKCAIPKLPTYTNARSLKIDLNDCLYTIA